MTVLSVEDFGHSETQTQDRCADTRRRPLGTARCSTEGLGGVGAVIPQLSWALCASALCF